MYSHSKTHSVRDVTNNQEKIFEKTPRFRRAFGLVGLFSCLIALAGAVEPERRYELKSEIQEERAPDDPLAALTAFVEIAAIQPDANRGIDFTLSIVNGGSHQVEFLDPFEFLRIELTNAVGLRVDLPAPPSLLAVNTKDEEGFRQRWAGRQPFDRVDPPPHADDGESHRGLVPKIDLGPQEEFSQRIRIQRVLADPEDYRAKVHEYVKHHSPRDPTTPPALPLVAPIGVGEYALKVVVLLGTGAPGPPPRGLASESMKVRLGSD